MKEASRNYLHSESTTTLVLVADDKILVANIGDSMAILSSENFQSPREAKGEYWNGDCAVFGHGVQFAPIGLLDMYNSGGLLDMHDVKYNRIAPIGSCSCRWWWSI
ncbi:putative protein phosphatase 2C 50 [Spatholobus suberectus]|nr:putative protein phosphatase 2C 50 [Spatholobus suberectus]